MTPPLFKLFRKSKAKDPRAAPADFQAVVMSADAAVAAGHPAAAVDLYSTFIDIEPGHALALYKRANLFSRLGRWDAALVDYDRAIGLDPGFANAHCNRGATLMRLSRPQEALAAFDRAIELNPHDHIAYFNRAAPLRTALRLGAALADYDRALALKPDYVDALVNRGSLLLELQRYDEALDAYDSAARFDAVSAQLCFNRGSVLQKLQRHDAAIADFDQAIELSPGNAEAYQRRGFSLLQIARTEEAIASFDQVAVLQPEFPYLAGMRRHAKMQIFDWEGLEEDVARITRELVAGGRSCLPFALLSLVDSPRLHRLAADIYVRDQCPPSDALPVIAPRPRRERIRVAYVSADFRDHPVAHLTAGLFESHDRSTFEILAFSYGGGADDPVRRRLEAAFDRFFDVSAKSDRETAALARELGVDIAVDLTGFTGANRTAIFGLRAAPIQMSYIGYLGTMAAPYMDYLIADPVLVPDEERHHYAERLIHLPCYQVNDSRREMVDDGRFSRGDLGLPAQGFVFSCFNANYKIVPSTFAIWMRILRRVEGSVLFLYAGNASARRNLLAEAARRGVGADRIVFGARLGLRDYMARFHAMDLFLDTLPYNAGTTASDALWAGLPVLTCLGRGFAGRVAASLLRALDLPELIATSAQQYEDLAVRLAMDPAELARIRQALARGRVAGSLFDTKAFTRHLEQAYLQVYERYLAKLPPADVFVRRSDATRSNSPLQSPGAG